MVRTKVFVGNLSFKTHEKDLQKEFEVAGKVASASIISRGSRSLGYGFVEMESEEDAKRSVELLNKKNIDNREINVEIARPREEKPPADPAAPAASGDGARGGATRGRRPYRGGGGGGGSGGGGGGRRPRRGPKPDAAGGEGSPAAGGEGGAPRAPRPRQPPPPRNDADKTPRTPSQDTLFVTNLPFSVDNTGLAAIFADMNIKAAHVVRKHNERSKGFGFVEFHNHDDQQKALNAINNKNVDGRELVVKVALTEVAKAAGIAATPASPATAAATPASPAPAATTTTTATESK